MRPRWKKKQCGSMKEYLSGSLEMCGEELNHEGVHWSNGPGSTAWSDEDAVGGRYEGVIAYCPVCDVAITAVTNDLADVCSRAEPCGHPIIVKAIVRIIPNPLAAIFGVLGPKGK